MLTPQQRLRPSSIVRKRDAYGNPTSADITVDGLPACLEIGIPFTKADIPSSIAQIGDSLHLSLGLAGASGVGLILMSLIGHRKRRKR